MARKTRREERIQMEATGLREFYEKGRREASAEMREEIRKLREQLIEERAARTFYFLETDAWDKMGPSWDDLPSKQKQGERDRARRELIEEGHLPNAADTASTATDCISGVTCE